MALVSLSFAIGETRKRNGHPVGDDTVFTSEGWYDTVVDLRTGRAFTYYAGPYTLDIDGKGGSAFEQIHQLLRDDE